MANPGSTRVSFANDNTSRLPTKRTISPNATWAATKGRMTPARPLERPPPDFSAVNGATLEARSAGTMPKSAVVTSASTPANVSSRQSLRRSRETGSSGDDSVWTTAGPANSAKRSPSRHAAPATSALSMSICWTSRWRLAPIDRRRAISRSRAAVLARNKLATFEPAISRTSPAIAPMIQSERSNCCRSGDGPLAADRR